MQNNLTVILKILKTAYGYCSYNFNTGDLHKFASNKDFNVSLCSKTNIFHYCRPIKCSQIFNTMHGHILRLFFNLNS